MNFNCLNNKIQEENIFETENKVRKEETEEPETHIEETEENSSTD